MELLTTNNYKTKKSNIKTFIMHLAPHTLSGKNVCSMATAGCAAACLNTAGRGKFNVVQNARVKRTKMFFEHREQFFAQLHDEITRAQRKYGQIAVRLNGTSDIVFEAYKVYNGQNIFEALPSVIFYDYTKIAKRFFNPIPQNYHLTFSYSGEPEYYKGRAAEVAKNVLSLGYPVAVVFSSIPDSFLGYPVINGDETDERFLNGSVIVGLTAKGKAKQDYTGFVVREEVDKYITAARKATAVIFAATAAGGIYISFKGSPSDNQIYTLIFTSVFWLSVGLYSAE